MLRKIQFKFGAGPGLPRLRCKPGVVTVFVGPNNAGKSRVLIELADAIGVPERDWRTDSYITGRLYSSTIPNPFILHDISLALPRDEKLRAAFVKAVAKEFTSTDWDLKTVLQNALSSNKDESNLGISQFGALLVQKLFSDNKIDARKLGYPDPQAKFGDTERHKAARQRVQPIFQELFEHVKAGRYKAIARKWISKGYIRLKAYRAVLAPHAMVLDGKSRLALVEDTKAIDWRKHDGNLLANLLKNPERLERLRRTVHGALGYYPVIDATYPKLTKLKFTREHPRKKERSVSAKSLRYFDTAFPIQNFSDGVRSFVGILAAVLSEDSKVVLIDEPEAFLHPPLARKLGAELHTLARENHAQVFAATHSPDFLMGCIESGADVSIVRLTYKEAQATARELKSDQIRDIMRHPLLRSTGVLGALFHEGAVVCESDSDRAFYQELNARMLTDGRGAQGVVFLNAQNKQTIERIIKPLRQMGIAAAAVLDIDVLTPGEDLSRLLMAAGIEPDIRTALTSVRDRFFKCCVELCAGNKEEAKKQLKQKGLQLLPDRERAEFRSILFRPLEDRGIFVVPGGELESWLPELSLAVSRSDKSKWLMKMFERLGDDPAHPEYVKPSQQGVWSFLDSIAAWIARPLLGIPFNS